jgi:hypothetical protein
MWVYPIDGKEYTTGNISNPVSGTVGPGSMAVGGWGEDWELFRPM